MHRTERNYTVVVSNDAAPKLMSMVALPNGWWKFDETEGTVASDSSGNENDGTLTNGPTWIEGKLEEH